ncbi:MAG TPA: methylaspartate ammonia-lyase [Bordetella sp.]
MKIARVLFSTGISGYLHRDLAAIKAGARRNGVLYEGDPIAPGFRRIVETADIVSVMLVLEDDQVAHGDCADVILAGFGGRDPAFRAADHQQALDLAIRPLLQGLDADDFRANAQRLDDCQPDGRPLHTAIRYGVSQALLHAAALSRKITITEVVAQDYGSTIATEPVKLLASCQRDDAAQLDRMILKRVDLLPHANFMVPDDVGPQGEKLLDYARGIARRIQEIGEPDYHPRIHLDVYGTLGETFPDPAALLDYLERLAAAAAPYHLLLESPVIRASRSAQIDALRELRQALRSRGIDIGLIADEWCNTLEDAKLFADSQAADYLQIKTPDLGGIHRSIEAVLYCRSRGMGACLGGTANETDQSARICAQVGLACGADFMLCKPGLGADEGLMILKNEMMRTLALVRAR